MRAILSVAHVLTSGLALGLIGCSAADVTLPSDHRPVELRAISGGGQEGTVGSRLPLPLVVGVRDGAGNPVASAQLVFRFRDEIPDAVIQPAEIQTDASGEASVEITLGSTAGSQTVEATLAQSVTPNTRAIFGLTARERRGRDREGGGGHGKDKEKDKD